MGQCQHHGLRVDRVARAPGKCSAIAAVEGIDMIAYGTRTSVRASAFISSLSTRLSRPCAGSRRPATRTGNLPGVSAETEVQIEESWRLGCKVLNLAGNDVSTCLDGLKGRASRARARLKSTGCRCLE
jgi:hypothetical protein